MLPRPKSQSRPRRSPAHTPRPLSRTPYGDTRGTAFRRPSTTTIAPTASDGEWYVFIVDGKGYTIAHHNDKFRDRDPSLRVDAVGYFYGDDLLGATEDGRWVDYVILNPESGENDQKHTWAVKHDGLIFASGWYER